VVGELGRLVGRSHAKLRARRLAAFVVPVALVGSLAAASWAASGDPVLVKHIPPDAFDAVSTSHGAWFGWAQNSSRDAEHYDFFVQRGDETRVKVNAAKTESRSGGIVGNGVYYAQQFDNRDPQIVRFDLKTGHRTPLPAKVNHYIHTAHFPFADSPKTRVLGRARGNVTVSGPWVLYSGFLDRYPDAGMPSYTVMLYNRATHQLRTLAAYQIEDNGPALWAGQVNGNYVTYWSFDGSSDVYRYNITTKRSVKLSRPASGSQYDPAVSADGTVYYFVTDDNAPSGGPDNTELVRKPVGGPAEVVTTLPTDSRHIPHGTFVKDRPDGKRIVFVTWKNGFYKYVDGPTSAPTRLR
jgi:hypothetical protein